jgi:hypothetical protein
VALLVDPLPQGMREIRTPRHAEAPGRFHALPVLGHAMTIPEIRANGGEIRIPMMENKE